MFIVGDSGSGKSTLIKLIMKELEPTSGTIIVNGNNLSRMKHRKVAMYQKKYRRCISGFPFVERQKYL